VPVDQNKPAGLPALVVGVKADRLDGRDIDECNLVEMQFLGGEMIKIFDVDAVFQLVTVAPTV